MKTNKLLAVSFLAFTMSSLLGARPASAFLTVSGSTGISSGSGTAQPTYKATSFYVGGDVTMGFLPLVEFGPFFDHNSLSYASGTGGESLNFYGIVGRLGIPMTGLSVDAKLGLSKHSSDTTPTDTTVGYGLGIGYDIPLAPLIALKPHLGYRALPLQVTGLSSVSHTFVDVGVMLSFGI